MIDSVFILSFGGVVLWSYCVSDESAGVLGSPGSVLSPLDASFFSGAISNTGPVSLVFNSAKPVGPTKHPTRLVNEIIRTVLVEERPTNEQQGLLFEELRFRWIRIATLNLMFLVASYPLVEADYVLRLLELLRDEFLSILPAKLKQTDSIATAAVDLNADALKYTTGVQADLLQLTSSTTDFPRQFKDKLFRCLRKCDKFRSQRPITSTPAKPLDFSDTRSKPENGIKETPYVESSQAEENGSTCVEKGLKAHLAPRGKDTSHSKHAPCSKNKKMPAAWAPKKVTKQTMGKLDFSAEKHKLPAVTDSGAASAVEIDNISDRDDKLDGSSDELETISEDEAWCAVPSVAPSGSASPATTASNKGFFGRISAAFANLKGNNVLEKENLAPVLEDFKSLLVAKGVANEVSIQLCCSVESSLLGKKTESFTSVQSSVRVALSQTVERILTQNKSIDLLKAALDSKARGSVYTICFLGVNGVGKSTNLAKVAYFLKHKGGLRVMIAACDTFRSGAVEQLQTHARNLGLEVYEQGYGRDAAHICKQAIQHATASRYDVVLIDTAGRMQDNEPLMRSLANLVALNSPNLILFVGEALVGNDAVDQLQKFNTSLKNFAPHTGSPPRGIDGIILTKFDTVDDKVGAALSMAYVSGQPIVFVGTGQKYTNLQILKVSSVLKSLLG